MPVEPQMHDHIFKRLVLLEKKGCLAHAYLFVGQKEIGKKETAVDFAKYLLCEKKSGEIFCNICPHCIKINGGIHPDVHVTSTEFGETIKIEQIREILGKEKLRPFIADKKIFIITKIENFTQEASNALLKTLEEPSPNSLLILTTSSPRNVLDTIKSRCHQVLFTGIPQKELKSKLEKYFDKRKVNTHFLSFFSEGSFPKAKRLEEEGILEKKDYIIDQFLFSDQSDALLKKVLSHKGETKEFLEICLSWIRDAMLWKVGIHDEKMIHWDRREDVKTFAGHYSFEDLKEIYDEMINVAKLFAENLNVKIPLLIVKEKLWAR